MSVNGYHNNISQDPLTSPSELTHQLIHSSPPPPPPDDIQSMLHPDLIAQTEAQLAQSSPSFPPPSATTTTNSNNALPSTSPPNGGGGGSSSIDTIGNGTETKCPVCSKPFSTSSDPKTSMRSHFRHMISKSDAAHKAYRDSEKELKAREVAASAKSKARDRVRKFRAARAAEAAAIGGVDRAKIQSKSATERRKLKKEVDSIPPPGPEPTEPVLPVLLQDGGKPWGNPYFLFGEVVGIRPAGLMEGKQEQQQLKECVESYKTTLAVVAPGQSVKEIFDRCKNVYKDVEEGKWDEASAKWGDEACVGQYMEYVEVDGRYRREVEEYTVRKEEYKVAIAEYEKMKDIESRVKQNVDQWWRNKGRLRISQGSPTKPNHPGDMGASQSPDININVDQEMEDAPEDGGDDEHLHHDRVKDNIAAQMEGVISGEEVAQIQEHEGAEKIEHQEQEQEQGQGQDGLDQGQEGGGGTTDEIMIDPSLEAKVDMALAAVQGAEKSVVGEGEGSSNSNA